jgi:hypothetical protein
MLEVDVEVAGTKQRVLLSSREIGVGGFFLRTAQPAQLWKKVHLSLNRPGGGRLEMSGEVVRRVGGDQTASGQPPGMAVAFDESSRGKYKDFVALVQSLTLSSTAPSAPPSEHQAPALQKSPAQSFRSIPDSRSGVRPTTPIQPTPAAQPAATTPPRPAHAQPAQPAPPPQHNLPVAQPSPTQPTAATDHQEPSHLKKFLDDYKNKHTGTTYYDALGLTLKATPQEIEHAYQQLSATLKITEPIENLPSELATELAATLNKVRKAYAILSKPDRKRAYDFIIDNSV